MELQQAALYWSQQSSTHMIAQQSGQGPALHACVILSIFDTAGCSIIAPPAVTRGSLGQQTQQS